MATLITPSAVAKEALIVLENNLVMGGLVHRDFSKEYQKIGATITIRKPTSFTATAFSTTVAVQAITETSVQVVLSHYDVTTEVTSQELSLNIVDFSQQVILPAMRALAQKIDGILCDLYADVNGHHTANATAAVSDISLLAAQLNKQKCPAADRRLVFGPDTEARYTPLDAFLHANKRADNGMALRNAALGRVMGFDTYMDQNIVTHSSAIADLAGAMKGAAVAGATAATIDALTDTEVIEDNALFKVAGDKFGYRITNGPLTVASTAITVVFAPASHAAWDDNAVVTLQAEGSRNMAFHKNAFALCTAPLEPPMGGAKGVAMQYKGLNIRVVYDYELSSKKNQMSFDLLAGVKTLDAELAALLCDAN